MGRRERNRIGEDLVPCQSFLSIFDFPNAPRVARQFTAGLESLHTRCEIRFARRVEITPFSEPSNPPAPRDTLGKPADQCRITVEDGRLRVRASGGNKEQDPIESELKKFPDPRFETIGRSHLVGCKHAEIQPLRRSPATRGFRLDRFDRSRQVKSRVYWKPTVAIFCDTLGNL